MDDEMTSAADDIAAAWDKVEVDETPTEEPEELESAELDDVSEPVEGDELPAGDDAAEPDTELAEQAIPESNADDEKGKGDDDDPAPISPPAAAREAWKDTPKAMKDAIAKRERDFAVGIQKYAEGAKRAQQMDQSLRPYQQYFAMNGNNPAKSIGDLLQTASLLQGGAPRQKAETVANLISQFGVDVETLDHILAGATPPEPQGQGVGQGVAPQLVQQAVQQAIAPYQQHMQQFQLMQQRAHQQTEQEVASELQTFATDPKHEFYNDVKMDMADILDLAAQRGLDLSLEDAYKRACLMNPDVSNVINSRTQQQQIQRKRRASASVSGSPAGPGGAPDPANLRGAIEAAWDSAGRT